MDTWEGKTQVKTPENEAKPEAKKNQDYYVDPLIQESVLKARKAQTKAEEKETEETPDLSNSPIRPDTNINGFFSTGATATKVPFSKRPASLSILKINNFFGIINAIYAVAYAIIFITGYFSAGWFLSLIYAYVVVFALINLFNANRSKKAPNADIKKYSSHITITSIISLVPVILLIIGWVVHTF